MARKRYSDEDALKLLREIDVKTFQGCILDVPEGVDVNQYTMVLVWCE